MTITDRLRLEHKIFRNLLNIMERTLSLPEDQRMSDLRTSLQILVPAMKHHERIEEKLLMPAAKGLVTFEPMENSHGEVHAALRTLEKMLKEHLIGTSGVAAERLIELLRDHMAEEEKDLFPALETALGPEKLEALGAQVPENPASKPEIHAP